MATIRPAEERDATAIQVIYSTIVQETFISFETVPPTVDEIRMQIAETRKTYPFLVAADAAGNIAGYAYASKYRVRAAYRWSVDVAVYVAQDAQGKGVGSSLVSALLDILTAQGYYQAFAVIALPNAASVGLHESLGFRAVGVSKNVGFKLGKWHDVGMWQKTLREIGGQPEECLPFDQFSKTDDMTAIMRHRSLNLKWS